MPNGAESGIVGDQAKQHCLRLQKKPEEPARSSLVRFFRPEAFCMQRMCDVCIVIGWNWRRKGRRNEKRLGENG